MKMKSPALLDGVSQLCLTPVHWFGQFERVALHVDGGQPRAVTTEAGDSHSPRGTDTPHDTGQLSAQFLHLKMRRSNQT